MERIPGTLAEGPGGWSRHFLSEKDKDWAGACSSELGGGGGGQGSWHLGGRVWERHREGSTGDSSIRSGEREQNGRKGHDRARRPS